MALIETSIQIDKPVEVVYAFLTNLENLKTLQPGIVEVALAGPLAVGTHYRTTGQVMGHNFTVESEIVALESNHKFGVKTLAAPPASPVVNTYILEPAAGGTRLTTQMETVILGGFPGVEDMVRNQLKATLDGTNATLKKILEG